MFRSVSATGQKLPTGIWITQMVDDFGVLITFRGIDRESRWILTYHDPRIGLEAEFWAYRHEEPEKVDQESPRDFWTVRLSTEFSSYVEKHPEIDKHSFFEAVEMNLAEALFRWPIFGNWNPFQANSVRMLRWDQPNQAHRIIDRPLEWSSSNG